RNARGRHWLDREPGVRGPESPDPPVRSAPELLTRPLFGYLFRPAGSPAGRILFSSSAVEGSPRGRRSTAVQAKSFAGGGLGRLPHRSASDGVTPNSRRKQDEKWLWLEKPSSQARAERSRRRSPSCRRASRSRRRSR